MLDRRRAPTAARVAAAPRATPARAGTGRTAATRWGTAPSSATVQIVWNGSC